MKKRLSLVLALLMICPLFFSCGSDWSSYLAEDTVSSVEEGDEVWDDISSMIDMLSVDSAQLPEFESGKEAVSLFRDSVLNHMCCDSYRKYAGNSDVLADIDMGNISGTPIAAISATEFESVMYRCFGGSVKLDHKSTELFTYNKESKVYVPITAPIFDGVDREIVSIDETENTYRVSFKCTAGDFSASYFALLIKREDGTCYFSLLMHG